MAKYLEIYLVIRLMATPFVSISQIDIKRSLSKFSIGIKFEPNYGYRLLNFSGINKPIAIERNASEVGRFGYSFGIELESKISKNILLSYGIQYLEFGYNTRFKELNFSSPGQDFPIRSKTEFFYQSVGVPLSIQYHFTKRKFNPYLKAGIQMDCILQKTAMTVLEFESGDITNSEHRSTLGFQRFPISALLGIGMEYNLSNRISMLAEPLFKKSITSLIADKTAKEKPYSIGLAVKIVYNFRR